MRECFERQQESSCSNDCGNDIYIPVVIIKDPEYSFAIFECEYFFIAIKAHNISKKRQEKEERKRRNVFMRPCLTQRAIKGHYNNQ